MKNILFFVVFLFVSCEKTDTQVPGNSQIKSEFVENLIEKVNAEAVEVEEPELAPEEIDEYQSEGTPKYVVSISGWLADTSTSTCVGVSNPPLNKYYKHTVAQNGNEIMVSFTGGKVNDSITNVTCDYLNLSQDLASSSRTERVVVMQSFTTPLFKAWTPRFTINFASGKIVKKSLKMIPTVMQKGINYQLGQSGYLINYFLKNEGMITGFNNQSIKDPITITGSWIPAKGNVIHYRNNHYGIISTTPELKSTKTPSGLKDAWVFRIKEQNASCNQKTTTKKVLWYAGQKIPSSNILRDSAYQFNDYRNP